MKRFIRNFGAVLILYMGIVLVVAPIAAISSEVNDNHGPIVGVVTAAILMSLALSIFITWMDGR